MSRKRQSSDAGSSDCKMGYATVFAGELEHEHDHEFTPVHGFAGSIPKNVAGVACMH